MLHKRPIILVIGANGQVGWELLRTLAPLGQVIGADMPPFVGATINLSQPQTLAPLFNAIAPNIVINAAAYTAVDRAEQERDLVMTINATAVEELGRLAAKANIPVVHYSTDFVFGGDNTRPYLENDATAPLSVYGATKLAGELALINSGATYLLFRTSWVYGVRGSNFLLTMRRLFKEREEVRVVNDQTGSPTWSRALAEVTAQAVARVLHGEIDLQIAQGIYHVTAGGSTTWFGFAHVIHQYLKATCRLTPIDTKDYPTPAQRPAYSVLDNSKLERVFGLSLPNWQISAEQCLMDLG
jgi:dTDP-4-dehydrorhamnose reductase